MKKIRGAAAAVLLAFAALPIFSGKASAAVQNEVNVISNTSISTGSLSFSWTYNNNAAPAISSPTFVLISSNAADNTAWAQFTGVIGTVISSVTVNNNAAAAPNTTNYSIINLASEALIPNTTYVFMVKASSEPDSSFVITSTATLANSAGTTLSTGTWPPVTTSTISVKWTSNLNPSAAPWISSYSVVLSTAGNLANPLANIGVGLTVGSASTSPVNGLMFTQFGLRSNARYFAYVAGINYAGVYSSYTIVGTTVTLPAAPTLAANVVASTATLFLQWNDNGNSDFLPFQSSYTVLVTTMATTDPTQNPALLPDIRVLVGVGNSTGTAVGLSTNSAVTGFANGGLAFTQAGLVPNTTYYVYMQTLGFDGVSMSSVTLATSGTIPPTAPSLGTVSVTTGSVTVNWLQGANPAGTVFAAVISTVNPPGAANSSQSSTVTTTGITASFYNLNSGTTYYFQVDAWKGVSPATSGLVLNGVVGSSSTLALTPAAAALTFNTVGANSMNVSWAANGNLETAPNLSTYTVVLSTIANQLAGFNISNPPFTILLTTGGVNAASYYGAAASATVAGLLSDTTYYLYVAANNGTVVNGAYATLGSTSTLALGAGNVVSALNQVWQTSMTLTFGTGQSSATTPATFNLVLSTNAALNWVPSANAYNALLTSTMPVVAFGSATVTWTGLASNSTYYLFAQVVNNNGLTSGNYSGTMAAGLSTLTNQPIPVAIGASTFTALGNTSVTVAWGSNSNPETAPFISTYSVILSTVPNFGAGYNNSASLIVSTMGANVFTSSVTANMGVSGTALIPNTTYFLYAAGINNAGVLGTGAALGSTSTLSNVPAFAPAPVNSTFSAVGAGQMTVTWSANSNPAGSTYTVVFASVAVGLGYPSETAVPAGAIIVNASTSPVLNGSLLSYTVVGLSPGINYAFFVNNVNNSGIPTAYVALGSATTSGSYAQPTAGAIAAVTSSMTVLTVDWGANGNPSVAPVLTTYTVIVSTIPPSQGTAPFAYTAVAMAGTSASLMPAALSTMPAGANPTATFTGLVADTTYYVYVGTMTSLAGNTTDYIAAGSSSTLAYTPQPYAAAAPGGTGFLSVWYSSANVIWGAGGNTESAAFNSTYTIAMSTINTLSAALASNGAVVLVGTAPVGGVIGGVSVASATMLALTPNSVYYMYGDALNWGGTGSFYASSLGTITTLAVTPSPAAGFVSAVNSNNNFVVGLSSGPSGATSGIFNAIGSTYTIIVTTVNVTAPTWFSGNATIQTAAGVTAIGSGSAGSVILSTAPAGTAPMANVSMAGANVLANTTYYAWALTAGTAGNSYAVEIATSISLAHAPAKVGTSTMTFVSVFGSSMTVTWSANGNPFAAPSLTTYTVTVTTVNSSGQIYAGDSTVLSTAPLSNTTNPQALLASGVSPNSVEYIYLQAQNFAGILTAYVPMGSTVTPALLPMATTPTFIGTAAASALTVQWNANGNAVNLTSYNLVLSTVATSTGALTAAGSITISTAPAALVIGNAQVYVTTTNASLIGNTTYFAYVNTVSQSSNQSAYVSLGSTITAANAPVAGASTLASGAITLNWTASNSTNTAYIATIYNSSNNAVYASTQVVANAATFSNLFGGVNFNVTVAAVSYNGISGAAVTFPQVTTSGGGVAAPAAPANPFSVVLTTGVTVNWTSNGSTSSYIVQIATSSIFATVNYTSSTASGITVVPFGASSSVAIGAFGSALVPDTTYYFRVQAVGANGYSAYTSLGSTVTLAAPPINTSTPTVAASTLWTSSATITFQNNGNPYNAIAQIQRSRGATSQTFATIDYSSNGVFNNNSAIGGVITSSYTPVDLLGCTQYSMRVRYLNFQNVYSAFDTNGNGTPNVVTFMTFGTTPTAPSGLTALNQSGNLITLTWNPSPTEGVASYNLYADTTQASVGVTISTGAAGNSQYIITLSTTALATSCSATSATTAGAACTTSAGLYQYTTNVLPGLNPGSADSFKITATHRCGPEDGIGTTASAVSTGTVAAVRATITSPISGTQVADSIPNSPSAVPVVTIQAAVQGTGIDHLVFHYAGPFAAPVTCPLSTSTAWVVISTVNASAGTPWTARLDLSQANGGVAGSNGNNSINGGAQVADGFYCIRAQAWNAVGFATANSSDASPAPIVINVAPPFNPASLTVSNIGSVIEGYDQGKQVVTKMVVLANGSPATIAATDPNTGLALNLAIPSGVAFSGQAQGLPVLLSASPQVTAGVVSQLSSLAPAGASGQTITGTNLITQICLGTLNTGTGACNSSGVTLAQAATLSLGYTADASGNIVAGSGGTNISPSVANIYSSPNTTTQFIGDATMSSPDTTNHLIIGKTSHFSFFAVFGAGSKVANDLSGVRVYPNPYRPHSSNPANTGMPMVTGNLKTGIVFDQLPANVTINIYTITGEKVASFSGGTSGAVQWDGRNGAGRDVATGGYFAVIKSGSSSVTKRLAIIR